jgi:hypothetical protein
MLNDVATPEGADAGPREINRRTIAKGVAWTVPVIVMATAAPAAAASQVDESLVGVLINPPGSNNSYYLFTVTLTNHRSTEVTAVIGTIQRSRGGVVTTVEAKVSPATGQQIPAGGQVQFTFRLEAGNDTGQGNRQAQIGDIFIVNYLINTSADSVMTSL